MGWAIQVIDNRDMLDKRQKIIDWFEELLSVPLNMKFSYVNELATKHNIAIQIDEKADIISAAKDTFSSWVYQKIRHLSTSKFYKFKHKFFLFLWPFSNFLFLISVVFSKLLHRF